MNQRRGIAWLLLVALIFLLAFVGGAGIYGRLNSNFVKPPLSTRLQIDYQLESALLLVLQSLSSVGPAPLPATFTYEPPRREILPGVMLSVLTTERTPEEIKLDAWAVGSRIERHLSARLFLGPIPATRADSAEVTLVATGTAAPTADPDPASVSATIARCWHIEFLPRRAVAP